jgi:predicted RecA/RadA family phage recombinase
MGRKVSDGLSIILTADADYSVGDPVEIDGVFGFAATDVTSGDNFAVTIGQEEREVTLPADAGGWPVGTAVYFDGSAFTATATANRLVGVVSGQSPGTGGGPGWILVDPHAWSSQVTGAN